MFECNIGRAANLALASLPNFSLPGDISASSRYYREDIAEPNFEINPDSTITVPTAPGIGIEVRPDRLAKYRRRYAAFDA
jgi:O-succinylbenzoate synthase